jgi:hypothetical protein
MKSKIFLPLLLILMLLLSACGSAATSTTPSAQGGTNPQGLPLSEKLAVGTLKLEGTGFAINAKQAVDLLPLWQVYSSLITSDTAAQEEKDALAQQIQETMTGDQIKAIDAMNLTQSEIFASMQQLGITTSQISANGTPQPGGNFAEGGGFPGGGGGGNFTGGGGGGGGNFAGGGGGGGGNFAGGGSQLTPSQIATAQARRAENGGGFNNNRLLTPLVEAVIKLLESK